MQHYWFDEKLGRNRVFVDTNNDMEVTINGKKYTSCGHQCSLLRNNKTLCSVCEKRENKK